MTRQFAPRAYPVPRRPVAPQPALPLDFRDTVSALLPATEAGDVLARRTGWVARPPDSDGDCAVQYLIFEPSRDVPFSARLALIHAKLDGYKPALKAQGLTTTGPTDAQPWMLVHPRKGGQA